MATAAIAFSSDSRVMMSLGRWPRASTSMTSCPARNATSSLPSYWAGTPESRIGEMPSISNAIAIVLAVNWPPQAPKPGEAASSISLSSSSVILPAACAPTASKTCMIVISSPLRRPGEIEPP